jgi:hypothetical protein
MKVTQPPLSQRTPSHGSPLVGEQSVSARHPPGSPAGQHSPLPQQMVPGMQLTMKKVHDPSTQAAPVQESESPSAQSASCMQVVCAVLVCATVVLPRPSQELARTPLPIRRSARRRSVPVPQIRAIRSNPGPSTSTLLCVARPSLSATRDPSGLFRLILPRATTRQGGSRPDSGEGLALLPPHRPILDACGYVLAGVPPPVSSDRIISSSSISRC